MFGSPQYHELIRKYVIVFGNLFNDICVQRNNSDGSTYQTLGVPIAYGPKEKFMVRIKEDPRLDKKVALTLPRMGFQIASMEYDPTRKLSSTRKNVFQSATDESGVLSQFVPVPYNINFELYIMVRNANDGTQIIEQILPYFRPQWNTNIKLIPSMDITLDVPYILQATSLEDAYEGDFLTRRALVWTLSFQCRGYLFGPTSTSGVIKRTNVNLYANTGDNEIRQSNIQITPGLLANGSPTSNSTASIPIGQISANSDYGFAIDITDFTDGIG